MSKNQRVYKLIEIRATRTYNIYIFFLNVYDRKVGVILNGVKDYRRCDSAIIAVSV